MDQDETTTEGSAEPEAAADEDANEGKVLRVYSIRVTIRDDADGSLEGTYLPTNDEAASWALEGFLAHGYVHVRARAEQV